MNQPPWDYLILTASNDPQAEAYESQLRARRETGRLAGVRETLVVADLEGRRIGSGGSTLECLRTVVNRDRRGGAAPEDVLRGLRILIVHAGGDSRRLPAYGPCGKIFVPVPGETDSALALTLFDLLAPPFLELPPPPAGAGQIVVAAGDALLRFDPSAVRFPAPGLTMLATPATPEEASRHGVFCTGADGAVRLYLQKPTIAEQARLGAVDGRGETLLDIGVTHLDAAAAAALMAAFGISAHGDGPLEWPPEMRAALLGHGIDLYREICCAMGREATPGHYLRTVRAAGSQWDEDALTALFPLLRAIPFHVQALPGCRFLHFGSTRQLVASGRALLAEKNGGPDPDVLALNNQLEGGGSISGRDSWVEGCRIGAPLSLGGGNVVIGVDVTRPLALPPRAALDVVEGRDATGHAVWFVRCYGVEDSFKDANYCGAPLDEWLAAVGASASDIWAEDVPPAGRTLWNARMFPAESTGDGVGRWLWMYAPQAASAAEKRAWLAAERRSAAEIALLAGQDAFHSRRAAIRAAEVRRSLVRLFSPGSAFSAADLAFALRHTSDLAGFAADILALARSGAGPAHRRPVLIKGAECPVEASRHGTPKRVFLREGVLPAVTQAAIGIMEQGFTAEPHSHPTMYENYYVLEGRAVYEVGGESFAVEPGDMIVVPPGAVHRQRVTEGPHRVFYWGIAV